MTFSDLREAENIKKYQKQILSRTGGRKSNEARLFHYTKIGSLLNIVTKGYLWLSTPAGMNDVLESKLIGLQDIDDLSFACFSRTNQNIAMFKMYAPPPDGVMLSITISEAKEMIKQKPLIVEKEELTREEADTELYWTGVCYKDMDSNRITTPGQSNRYISNPLKELAGIIKLSGWEYEKEVRLCARKRLYSNQKLAVKMPENVKVILCPFFDREKHKNELASLTAIGIDYESSFYEEWLNKQL